MPLLTVMIPVYNGERYLADALNSVLSQPFTDLEALVLDDGSSDETPRICQEFSRRDARVVVSRHTNVGLGRNRNLGYPLIRGRWLIFLDHDDILIPGVLSKGLAQILSQCERAGVGMVVTSRVRADSQLENPLLDPIPLDGIYPSRGGCAWKIPYELSTNIYRTDVVVGNNILFAESRPEMESIFRHQAAVLAGKVLFCRNAALEIRRSCDTQITRNWNRLRMRAVRIAGYAALPDWHRSHKSPAHDVERAYGELDGTIIEFFRCAASTRTPYDKMKDALMDAGVSEETLSPNSRYTRMANSLLKSYRARDVKHLRALSMLCLIKSLPGKCAGKALSALSSQRLSRERLERMAVNMPECIGELLRSEQDNDKEI